MTVSAPTILSLDPNFIQEQRQEILDAMGIIFKLFGGADKFHAATSIPELRFVLTAKPSCAEGDAVACYIGNGIIEMTVRAFNPAPLVSGWYIAHEVGHAFDFSRSRGRHRSNRSQAFVDHFLPKNRLKRIFWSLFMRVAGFFGYLGKTWTEMAKNTGTTRRGELNPAEDFAEAFAVAYAQAVTHGELPYRSFNSRWRLNIVKEMMKGKK